MPRGKYFSKRAWITDMLKQGQKRKYVNQELKLWANKCDGKSKAQLQGEGWHIEDQWCVPYSFKS